MFTFVYVNTGLQMQMSILDSFSADVKLHHFVDTRNEQNAHLMSTMDSDQDMKYVFLLNLISCVWLEVSSLEVLNRQTLWDSPLWFPFPSPSRAASKDPAFQVHKLMESSQNK